LKKQLKKNFAVCGVANRNSILVTSRDEENSYYMAEVIDNIHGNEHESHITTSWITPINLSWAKKLIL